MLLFGSRETSDAWVDALKLWWLRGREGLGHIKRLVIYLDNGPKNSGTRTQWLRRLVEFCDWSGLEIRLVYYPPYHSKYNPIERCWGILEMHWNGSLLDSIEAVVGDAESMTWKGKLVRVDLGTGGWVLETSGGKRDYSARCIEMFHQLELAAEARRVRRDAVAEIAGRRAAERFESELDGAGGRN